MGLGFVGTETNIDGSSSDVGRTEILQESPFLAENGASEAGKPPVEPALSLVSLNDKTASTVDFSLEELRRLSESGISCGRGEANPVHLPDPRISLRHFTILLGTATKRRPGTSGSASTAASSSCGAGAGGQQESPEEETAGSFNAGSLQLLDESSNGTWLNDQLVGKDRCLPLAPGDRIFVLPAARVGHADVVGFAVLVAGDEQRPRTGLGRQLAADLRCRLCTEKPIHRCVTTIPCGHIFDLGCLIAWRHRSNRCPECGLIVAQVVRNRGVDSMAETFLQKHPEAARAASTLKLLEVAEKSPASQTMLNRLTMGVPTPVRSVVQVMEEAAQANADAAGAALPRHLKHLARFAAEAAAAAAAAAAAPPPPPPVAPVPPEPAPQAPAAPAGAAPQMAPVRAGATRSRACTVM